MSAVTTYQKVSSVTTITRMRRCAICGSDKTYLYRDKKENKAHARWHILNGGYVCHNCYSKDFMKKYYPEHKEHFLALVKQYKDTHMIESAKSLGMVNCSKCGKRGQLQQQVRMNKKTGRISEYRGVLHRKSQNGTDVYLGYCHLSTYGKA